MNTYSLLEGLQTLRLEPIQVYSMSDILAIHNYLFQDVYAWAG